MTKIRFGFDTHAPAREFGQAVYNATKAIAPTLRIEETTHSDYGITISIDLVSISATVRAAVVAAVAEVMVGRPFQR